MTALDTTTTTAEVLPSRPHFRGGEAGTRWKFDVAAYHKMAEVGILVEDDHVELIDGEVIVMSPIGDKHYGCVAYLSHTLAAKVGIKAFIVAQSSVHLDDHSEPEPDLVLVRPRDDFYRTAKPRPADVLLLVEVMDSSASYDRGRKLSKYARSGIGEVWLVDLNREVVEVCRRLVEGAYAERREMSRGQSLAPEAFPDVVLEVDAILG